MKEFSLGKSFKINASIEGGTWSSSNPSVATITEDGVVTTLSVGRVIFTYTYTDELGCTTTAVYEILVTCTDKFWHETLYFEIPCDRLVETVVDIPVSAVINIPTKIENMIDLPDSEDGGDDDTSQFIIEDIPTEFNWTYPQTRYEVICDVCEHEECVTRWDCCGDKIVETFEKEIVRPGYVVNGQDRDIDNNFISDWTFRVPQRVVWTTPPQTEAFWNDTVVPPQIDERTVTYDIEYEQIQYIINTINKSSFIEIEEETCVRP